MVQWITRKIKPRLKLGEYPWDLCNYQILHIPYPKINRHILEHWK